VRDPARPPVVVASAGLGFGGGGAAVVGRLTLAAVTRYAAEHGVTVEALALVDGSEVGLPCRVRQFHGRQLRMAVAVWRLQTRRQRPRLLFDRLGPARAQALVPRFARAPYLVWMLGIEVWRPLSGQRRRALERATVRLAISAHTRDRAQQLLPWLPATEVVALGLEDRPTAGEVDRSLLEQAGAGFMLIVGRMARSERYKGHDKLLELLPAVAGGLPDARLVVVGEGDDLERLRRSALERGLAGRVLFTGFVSEATLSELYARCAALVMPSRDEGFGLVYLEAMRASRPVVALRNGAAEEIVEDGVTGALVEPGDDGDLVAALHALLTTRELRGRLGAAGRRRFEERFTFSAFEKRFRPHLSRLMSTGMEHVRH
jgi:phosphatidylinositol alpha-1,6-mannosyltransferase